MGKKGVKKPKLKTNKSAAKRYSFTATGKIKFKKAGLRHGMSNKNRKRKRPKTQAGYVFEGERSLVERALPYGSLI